MVCMNGEDLADVEGKTGRTASPEAEGVSPGGFLDGWELSTYARERRDEAYSDGDLSALDDLTHEVLMIAT